MNPLITRLLRLFAARPACWPYIIKLLEKKKNLNDLMNTLLKNAVSLIYYTTDRGIIDTSLKTSFSPSHFSLFSPIPIEQIPAFPREGKSPGEEVEQILRTVQERTET